jgi:hypothetical protein
MVHGVNEWLDMFILISPEHEMVLDGIHLLTLPISFFFLIQFGVSTIVKIKNKNPALKLIPFYLLSLWLVIAAVSGQKLLIGDISARYLLCVPGALLTAYALLLHLPDCMHIHQPAGLSNMMKLTAGSFILYALFSGVIVPEAQFFPASVINYTSFFNSVGFPIQFFRTFCAVVISYAIIRILNIFEWETVDSLRKAHDDLESRVRMRTKSLHELSSELREALDKAKKV